eukprot:CAMPEP_0197693294 /NCGR_PEP_ID=MMETSP1338-20131121/112300_1 /TAXON_ID=43686 ORGANISM="Pelagodinium beii, Strain RCC1491" /NCGR_SAMPLE_ID=MMETSP1338 /ASSEMBLY_ACC=CAM_ASM_000754 /LENGTH=139 /DNA_ID=CAMNT_0043276019 /DNA_START=155 /DNA_END=571 /DNA_ORIENTATION=+
MTLQVDKICSMSAMRLSMESHAFSMRAMRLRLRLRAASSPLSSKVSNSQAALVNSSCQALASRGAHKQTAAQPLLPELPSAAASTVVTALEPTLAPVAQFEHSRQKVRGMAQQQVQVQGLLAAEEELPEKKAPKSAKAA